MDFLGIMYTFAVVFACYYGYVNAEQIADEHIYCFIVTAVVSEESSLYRYYVTGCTAQLKFYLIDYFMTTQCASGFNIKNNYLWTLPHHHNHQTLWSVFPESYNSTEREYSHVLVISLEILPQTIRASSRFIY